MASHALFDTLPPNISSPPRMSAPAGAQEEFAGTPGLRATLPRPLGGASRLEKLRQSQEDALWMLVSVVLAAAAAAAAVNAKNEGKNKVFEIL